MAETPTVALGAPGIPARWTSSAKSGVGTAFSPAFLLNAIKALATSWAAANPFGLDLEDASDPGTVRSDILEAVRLLATAKARKR